MLQQQLSIEFSIPFAAPKPATWIEKFCGLTPWISSRLQTPLFVGWYRCYNSFNDEATPIRRYWDGARWSLPVHIGMDNDDVDAHRSTHMKSERSAEVVWCGLQRPHLVGYWEPLMLSTRTGLQRSLVGV